MAFIRLFFFESTTSEGGNGRTFRRAVKETPRTTPHTRLSDQMFSFTLVLQLIPLIVEIGAPFAVKFVKAKLSERKEKEAEKNGKGGDGRAPREKDFVVQGGDESAPMVKKVLDEAALPEHRFFGELSITYMNLIQHDDGNRF